MILNLLQITGKKGTLSEALGQIYEAFMNSAQKNRMIDDGVISYELTTADFFRNLASISSLIGGIGALFYISYRVWKQLANGEPIAIFPLLRPFVIGLCILNFNTIVRFTNGLFYQLIRVTEDSSPKIANIQYSKNFQKKTWSQANLNDGTLPDEIREAAYAYAKKHGPYLRSRDHDRNVEWYVDNAPKEDYRNKIQQLQSFNQDLKDATNLAVIPGCDSDIYGALQVGKKIECAGKNMLKWIVGAVLFLIIFFLNVYRFLALCILYGIGPLALGLSIFDGFQNSLKSWVTRYVNIYFWLPVANIMQSVLGIIAISINALYGSNFWYMLFFGVMCIFVFFRVPQITSWVVQAPMEDGGGFMGAAIGGAVGGLASGAGKVAGAAKSKGASLASSAGSLLKKSKKE